MIAKVVAWESLIGLLACVNFRYKLCLVVMQIASYFKALFNS